MDRDRRVSILLRSGQGLQDFRSYVETFWMIQVGQWKTFEDPNRLPVQAAFDLKLGPTCPRNKEWIVNGADERAKLQAARSIEECSWYCPMTKISSKEWLLMLVWNGKKDSAPALPFVKREDSRGETSSLQRSHRCQPRTEGFRRQRSIWHKSKATTLWLHCRKGASLFKKLWRFHKSKPP